MASPGVDQGALLLRRQLTGALEYLYLTRVYNLRALLILKTVRVRVYSNNFTLYWCGQNFKRIP